MNKVTLWFKIISVTVLLMGLLFVSILYAVAKNYGIAIDMGDSLVKARLYYHDLKKVANETEYKKFIEEDIWEENVSYFCVMNADGSVRFPPKADDISRQVCEDEKLKLGIAPKPGIASTVDVPNVNIHDDHPYQMYQISFDYDQQGENPKYRIFIKLQPYNSMILDYSRNFAHSFYLLIFMIILLLFIVYWILNPLRQIGKEVATLKTDGSERIDVVKYPRELASLAEVLNSFISATLEARQEAEKAEQRAIDAQRKTNANREEILRKTIELSNEMIHHRSNILPEDALDEAVNSSTEIFKEDFRHLIRRVYRIINYTDSFIKEICAVRQEDISMQYKTEDIYEMLKDMIIFFREDTPEKNFKATGLKRIQDIQVSITPQMLIRICSELLVNATKYSDSEVLIQASRNDNSVWIKFHNDGEKFPEKNRDTMFYYGERANFDRPGGTGRGLFFVKKAADISGCFVELQDSNVLSGACVYLEIPLAHNGSKHSPSATNLEVAP